MSAAAQPATITARQLNDDERFECLPGLFSKPYMMAGEKLVYSMAERLSSHYEGGYWHMYHLSNGAYYMAPSAPARFSIDGDITFFNGSVSADGMGVIACLFALGALCHEAFSKSNHAEAEHLSAMYGALLDYAVGHPDSSSIFGAID